MSGLWFSSVRHVLGALINPVFMTFVLIFVTLIYCAIKTHRRGIQLSVVLLSLLLLAITTGWLPRWMIQTLEAQYTQVKQADPHVQVVVVLGGGAYPDIDSPASEVLSGASIKRLLEGVRLYRQLSQATLILSGGGAWKEQESVGVRLNELAAWFDIPEEHRVVEIESINTEDEARVLKKMLNDVPFYLVTSAVHMPRAIRLFERQGLYPIAAPCDYVYYWKGMHQDNLYLPNAQNVAYVSGVWHEILGLIWHKLKNNLRSISA